MRVYQKVILAVLLLAMVAIPAVAASCAGSGGEVIEETGGNTVKFVHDEEHGVGIWYQLRGGLAVLPDSQYRSP